jgi:hypothetical protein
MNSSGLLYTLNPDGSAFIGYEDYDVEIFGGSDYEVMYLLDKENFELLCKHLSIKSGKDARHALVRKFGEQFDSIRFENCKIRGYGRESSFA